MEAALTTAQQLGYAQVKNRQYEAIENFVCGKDGFTCLPTGGGKLCCYAVLPAVFNIFHQRDESFNSPYEGPGWK